MEIKSVATTAKIVIESLVVLLDSKGVDVESIKMDINGGGQELDFKKLIELAVSELKLIQDSGAQVPEGFVVVPMEPTEQILNRMTNAPIEVNHLCDNADIFLSEDEARIAYKAMLSAQEQSND